VQFVDNKLIYYDFNQFILFSSHLYLVKSLLSVKENIRSMCFSPGTVNYLQGKIFMAVALYGVCSSVITLITVAFPKST